MADVQALARLGTQGGAGCEMDWSQSWPESKEDQEGRGADGLSLAGGEPKAGCPDRRGRDPFVHQDHPKPRQLLEGPQRVSDGWTSSLL